jgi:hypothetical protein
MARQEHSREDILREATALVERIELRLSGEEIIVGFRRDGSASFFFGAEFVIQFNSRNEIRRAYWNGRLVKAEHGQLHFMDRERLATEVVLRTKPLNSTESTDFLAMVKDRLQSVRAGLRSEQAEVGRQHPVDQPIAVKVLQWLERQSGDIAVAQKPNVG